MAARLRLRHQEDVRAKIQVDRLITYLHAGIFGEKFQEKEVSLDAVKVSAIKALLDKRLPNLSQVQGTGEDGAHKIDAKVEVVIVDAP